MSHSQGDTQNDKSGDRQPNRLLHESSPYLQQHAYNPVDWYPWGEEALDQARQLDRPIFLSIGYSACHWCHVMEHESFEHPQIAGYMNEYFINIKVDREERPDLDQIYMNAVMALTGRGGWPMSVFLTPDLRPFYGGTYWPPFARMQMPGFADILQKVQEAWSERRDAINQGADELTRAVREMGLPQGEAAQLGAETLQKACQQLIRAADMRQGGFGGAPKFPHAMDLRVLLRCWKRFQREQALEVVTLTLDKMATGGIYDHLGGGFHRYSTDARWLVPHFEKMLYDNALLVPVYLEAWQITRKPLYKRVVRETLDYVSAEMTSPEGGFYSTQDADSEGVEGKFFVWEFQEILNVLGEEAGKRFVAAYDVTPQGNWEGHNILNCPVPWAEVAKQFSISEEDLACELEESRAKLLDVREGRIAPGRDEKVLVSWNGLMIAAMAQASAVFEEPLYRECAKSAADFLLKNARQDDGTLLHSWNPKDRKARFTAYLDDYAALVDGLAELYQVTFEEKYLTAALELTEIMVRLFRDEEHGGFFYTGTTHETLIARNKDSQDNATPSGNSLAATALLKLARLTARTDLEELAQETLNMMSGQMSRISMASGQALIAFDFLLGPTKEIVIAESESSRENEEVYQTLHRHFLPNRVLLRRPAGTTDEALPKSVQPLLQGKTAPDEKPAIYVCEQGTCHAPVHGAAELAAALNLKTQ